MNINAESLANVQASWNEFKMKANNNFHPADHTNFEYREHVRYKLNVLEFTSGIPVAVLISVLDVKPEEYDEELHYNTANTKVLKSAISTVLMFTLLMLVTIFLIGGDLYYTIGLYILGIAIVMFIVKDNYKKWYKHRFHHGSRKVS